jgi:hypothetical protein
MLCGLYAVLLQGMCVRAQAGADGSAAVLECPFAGLSAIYGPAGEH